MESHSNPPSRADSIESTGQGGYYSGAETSSVASSEYSATTTIPADGEYGILLGSLEDDDGPSSSDKEGEWIDIKDRKSIVLTSLSGQAVYGKPLTVDEAAKRMPVGDESGLVWHSMIVPEEFFVQGRLKRGLNASDFDLESVPPKIKPRRPSLPVTASDFLSSITKIPANHGGCGPSHAHPRYIFYGCLNGWPSLRCLELITLEQKRHTAIASPKEIISGQLIWMTVWKANEHGADGVEPSSVMDPHRVYRATLRGAPWTSKGWSRESPGFVFWYESQRKDETTKELSPRVTYGTNLMDVLDDGKCINIHMLSHRYAVPRETTRDRLTYHSICLLEWDHQEYTTVIEAAYLNGIGGYKGKSNWYADRDEPVTALYQAFPAELVCPWRVTNAEIRCYDIPAKDFYEFQTYVWNYQGSEKRFVDPQFTFSHPVRLSFRSKRQIAQYLINYVMRDSAYAELKRNCQTFTADLCCFMAGKKDVVPFHPVSRVDYQNRAYFFLYDFHMYTSKEEKKKQKKK